MNMRNEYPRPNFKRDNYQLLNGEWGFDFDDENKYLKNNLPVFDKLTKTINVPFTYQTELSGINDSSLHEIMWYEKKFDLAENLKNKSILLNFNAVDNRTMVFLNGVYLGEHDDGYTSFSFDISSIVKEKDNHLIVRVEDRYDPTIPRGKQYWNEKSSRCWYNSNSGIWQSVWLEAFNQDFIKCNYITPDIDTNSVEFLVENAYGISDELVILISYKGKHIRKMTLDFDNKEIGAILKLRADDYIDEIHYWTTNNPNLYDVTFLLLKDKQILDKVETYFGFRKIHINEKGEICLNNKKIYQRLILDQGYFDGGDITPPSIDIIKKDILLAKEMGFNGARKHQKIEDPYFYYYADKLGYLVWAEMPSAYNFNNREIEYTTSLMQRIVKQLYNHPSIITWVPFNESWGVRKVLNDSKQKALVKSVYHLIKAIDSTRLVDSNDGWEQVNETDFIAVHDYSATGDDFIFKYQKENLDKVQPMGRKLIGYNEKYLNQPVLLTEYGGLSHVSEVGEDFYGYHVSNDKNKLLLDFSHLQENVRMSPFSGFCYTQLTDVKQETNGLLDAKREPKYDLRTIRKIILGENESKDFFD